MLTKPDAAVSSTPVMMMLIKIGHILMTYDLMASLRHWKVHDTSLYLCYRDYTLFLQLERLQWYIEVKHELMGLKCERSICSL